MKDYIKLLRVKHYLKNFLIFVPLFFSQQLYEKEAFIKTTILFIVFSLFASSVYIFNDIIDRNKDKLHEVKKNRPIASGKISIKNAVIAMIVLYVIGLIIGVAGRIKTECWELIIGYIILNVLYSIKLKKIPVIDVFVLVMFYIIRLVLGCLSSNSVLSFWMFMAVLTGSFYMGYGKRRNELNTKGNTREVLKYYNKEFLNQNMYICMGMMIMFYALWCNDINTINRIGTNKQMWTIPLVLITAQRYSLDIEKSKFADPINIITGDKWLIAFSIAYVAIMYLIIYN